MQVNNHQQLQQISGQVSKVNIGPIQEAEKRVFNEPTRGKNRLHVLLPLDG